MTRVDGLRRTMQRCVLATAVGAILLGCKGSAGSKGDSSGVTGVDVRSDLLAEAASNYTYGAERTPVTVDTSIIGGPGGPLPTITISTATQNSATGRVPGNRFIYRLTSSDAYPAMGLAPGANYIWRDTSSGPEGPYRTLVVPQSNTYPMMWLQRDMSIASYVPGPAIEPRLVKSAFGYGACDNNCSPHCASRAFLRTFGSRDSLKLTLKP